MDKRLVAELFDYADGCLYWKVRKSHCNTIGKEAGSYTYKGYRRIVVDYKEYVTHRLVYLLHHGYVPEYIDHINGIKDDNRIENLRAATGSENMYNIGVLKSNTSGVKGVYWVTGRCKWRAGIRYGGKRYYLGMFDDLELAELVVREARELLHGEYANHG